MNRYSAPAHYYAHNLQEVLDSLTEIIDENCERDLALGYFPTLYRRMTNAVIDGIAKGDFENNKRMENLIVVFANLYLDAYYNYTHDLPVCATWKIAFDAAQNNNMIVLQHLLMGVNAHINYDLGIAASQICRIEELEQFKPDFEHINDIIESLINDIQNSISEISLPMRFVDYVGGTKDEELINFNIRKARDDAWKMANQLAVLSTTERAALIQEVDAKSKKLSEKIAYQKGISAFIVKCIRWSERGKTKDKIRLLMN